MRKIIILILSGAILGSAFLDDTTKGLGQLCIVLVLVFAIRADHFARRIVPTAVLLLTVAGALGGAVFHYSHVSLPPDSFLVAMRTQSELREDVKIYRDRLRKSIRYKQTGLFSLHPSQIESQNEAQRELSENPKLGGIVWGDARWTQVSLQSLAPIPLRSFAERSVGRSLLGANQIADLLLIRSIPGFGLSDGSAQASIDFIGQFAAIWPEYRKATDEADIPEDLSGVIDSLARSRSRWTSRVHLAVPFWMSGNSSLLRTLAASEPERGTLSCAIARFKTALRQAKSSDNPTLVAAIKNNLAIALYARSYIQGRGKKTRKLARKHLRRVGQIKRIDSRIKAVISHNRSLVGHMKKGGRKKRGKKRRSM